MVFALLIARDHLEPGHVVSGAAGLELAHADRLDHRRRPGQPADVAATSGTSGVDWAQATKVGHSLLLSPLVGFVAAGLLLLALKLVARNPSSTRSPRAPSRRRGGSAAC